MLHTSSERIRMRAGGDELVRQGDPGGDLFLLLDGVLSVDVDGVGLGQLGPGTVFGERAALESGRRTSTLRAVTRCKLAVAAADSLEHDARQRLAQDHRREVREVAGG